jgi:hypothetical protein
MRITDTGGHYHEALYWAEREAQKVRELGGPERKAL